MEMEAETIPLSEMAARLLDGAATLRDVARSLAECSDGEWTDAPARLALARWALLAEILAEYRGACERAAGVEHVWADVEAGLPAEGTRCPHTQEIEFP